MKLPRVLQIITRMDPGGAQLATLSLVEKLQSQGQFDLSLAAGSDNPASDTLHARVRQAGISFCIIDELVREVRPVLDLKAVLMLNRFIRDGKFDLVNTHRSKAGILGRIAARLASVPAIVHTMHGPIGGGDGSEALRPMYIALERICASFSDVILSVSHSAVREALKFKIGTPKQYLVVRSGLDVDAFASVSQELCVEAAKARLGIPPDALVVGKIAWFTPAKGHDYFFEAARRVAEAEPRSWFLLVGDGLLREHFDKLAVQLGLRARTTFAGKIQLGDMPRYIQAMDVVAHTSLKEGLPQALVQAAVVGKPVVTFDLDGSPEVVRHGYSGYLVAPFDIGALTRYLVLLLRSPGLREEFAKAGQRLVGSDFSIDHVAAETARIYQGLIERSRPRKSWHGPGETPVSASISLRDRRRIYDSSSLSTKNNRYGSPNEGGLPH